MHELSVTQEVLNVAVEYAERAGARRITDITLTIGNLSSVVNDSVQFYFDFLSEDTMAAGAQLHFHRVAARLRCRQCEHEFEPRAQDWRCPQCQALGGEVIAGKEFYLDNIEVE